MKTIIVGIDGSHAAITAALWGVDEAISRAVPLRLVSVIKPTHPSPDDYDRDLAHAERSLREAQSAVEAAGKLVKIETDIPRGPAGPVLVEASRDAEMICVGSVGIGRYASSILGSTATELAEKAHCPVAVMRSKVDQPASDINWIVVRMTDAPDNEAVLEYAAREAKLRQAPILALGGRPEELREIPDGEFERRVQDWHHRHPDVRVYPITTHTGIARFLADHDERVQLAVIGGGEAGQLARLVGPSGHPVFRHACHDDRRPRQLSNGFAYRPHQHSGVAAAAPAADHDQLGFLGALDELAGRLIAHHHAGYGYVGIPLLPTRQPLGQHLLGHRLSCRPIDSGPLRHIDVAPCVQRHQVHVSPRRFVECDCGRQLGGRRAVNAN